jgi:hypothetical protein
VNKVKYKLNLKKLGSCFRIWEKNSLENITPSR